MDEKEFLMISALIKEIPSRFDNILNTPKYNRRLDKRNYGFRKKVIAEKGKTCADCKKELTDKEIEVSHLLPVELFPEHTFDMWNVFVKCHDCNLKDGHYQFRRMKREEQHAKERNERARDYLKSRIYRRV